jgi:hypothetical protein
VIHRLIVAASYDPTEEAAANSRFAETYRAMRAFPDQDLGDLLSPLMIFTGRVDSSLVQTRRFWAWHPWITRKCFPEGEPDNEAKRND